MGTYFHFVNHQLREIVTLSNLRDGGDKDNAVEVCSPALTWLMAPWWMGGDDGYCGRWHYGRRPVGAGREWSDIRIETDAEHDPFDLLDYGTHGTSYVDITPGLRQSMIVGEWAVETWSPPPRTHVLNIEGKVFDVQMGWVLPDVLVATCSCGWKSGHLHGDNRVATLELMMSSHIHGI